MTLSQLVKEHLNLFKQNTERQIKPKHCNSDICIFFKYCYLDFAYQQSSRQNGNTNIDHINPIHVLTHYILYNYFISLQIKYNWTRIPNICKHPNLTEKILTQ